MQALIIALLVLAAQSGQAGQPSRPSPQDFSEVRDPSAPRRLIVTYSDGRSVPRLLTTKGGSWSYNFPRQANPPTHDGLPLVALGINHVVDPDVVVTVFLQYGTPESRIVQVSQIRLTGAEPVRVTELEAFGVDPILVSLGAFPRSPLVQPIVSSVSSLLDASVAMDDSDLPIYRIWLRNSSKRAVMAVAYRTYRGDVSVISGWRKTNRSTPVIEPVSDYYFTLAAGSGEKPGFDRFEVSGVLWEDGTVEGDQALKASEQTLAIGYAQQLRRVLVILAEAVPASGSTTEPKSVAQVRAALAALPIAIDRSDTATLPAGPPPSETTINQGQVQVKNAVLRDVDDYVHAHGGNTQAPARPWIVEAQPRYSAWLVRTGGR